jgi:hypothetical protein
MQDFLTDFQEMIVDVTVKRQIVVDELAPRKEFNSQIITLKGIILPVKLNGNGSTSFHVTKDYGSYKLGDIFLYTTEELQCGSDIVVFDGREYEVTIGSKYAVVIPHNRYVCSSIV